MGRKLGLLKLTENRFGSIDVAVNDSINSTLISLYIVLLILKAGHVIHDNGFRHTDAVADAKVPWVAHSPSRSPATLGMTSLEMDWDIRSNGGRDKKGGAARLHAYVK